MVEKARTIMARKLEIPQWKADGLLPSPTSPLDRASPSPRGWRHHGVGLGILAALESEGCPQQHAAAAAVPTRRVVSVTPRRAARLEVSELGCSGRCATSLCGGGGDGSGRASSYASARTTTTTTASAFRVAEFLSCCDMCRKQLDGKDIFMYRGERAFCSMECRYHAIVSDEFQEEKERKRRAMADVPKKSAAAEMAGSPCTGGAGGQIFFTTGIVAA